MKTFFKTFFLAVVFFIASNLFSAAPELKANTVSEKKDFITIVRTVENGIHYIVIYVGDVMVCKDIEL